MRKPKVVAIDGPAGSGKTTVSLALAQEMGLACLDTGAMYRAVACAVLRAGADPQDEENAVQIARQVNINFKDQRVFLDEIDVTEEIRATEATRVVSIVAAYPQIREELRKRQLNWLAKNGGGVLEGRDIGTVVCPDADIKVFLTADEKTRASRRAKETEALTKDVQASIHARDKIDRERKHAPLQKAPGALTVDTTGKTVTEVVAEILEESRKQRLSKGIAYGQPYPFLWKLVHQYVVIQVVHLLYRVYFRGEVKNRKGYPKKGAFIMAPAGHRSNLDTPLVGSTVPRLMRYMAKESLFYHSRFRNYLTKIFGGFPVDRNKIDLRSMKLAESLLKRGEGLVLFPEGARQEGPDVLPLFEGVVWLSKRTGAPILPVGMAGGEEAMPKGVYIPRPKKIKIIVGSLIPAPDPKITRKDITRLTEELRAELQRLFDEAKKR